MRFRTSRVGQGAAGSGSSSVSMVPLAILAQFLVPSSNLVSQIYMVLQSNHYGEAIMKIAVLGATGMAGSRIVTEALRRGHSVTGVARHSQDATPKAGLVMHAADVNSPTLTSAL